MDFEWVIMSTITAGLNRLYSHLLRLNRPVASLLEPGLDRGLVFSQFEKLGLNSNEALIELFTWRNGTDPTAGRSLGELWVFPGYYLMSLNEACDAYRFLVEMYEYTSWPRTWFPLFGSGTGDYYAIILENGPSDDGEIVNFLNEVLERHIHYHTLANMLETLAECYSCGALYVDQNGDLWWDYQAWRRIGEALNPGVAYWKLSQ